MQAFENVMIFLYFHIKRPEVADAVKNVCMLEGDIADIYYVMIISLHCYMKYDFLC